MRILQIYPIQVESIIKHCDHKIKDSILIGGGTDYMSFHANLTFLPFTINPNESIVKATLKLYCKKIWGNHNSTAIHANDDQVSATVSKKDYYEWEVTNCIPSSMEHSFDLTLFTNGSYDCCSIKEFEAFYQDKKPVLEIVLETTDPNPSSDIVSSIEGCIADKQMRSHIKIWH